MDRLYPVAALALALAWSGCKDESKGGAADPPERTNTVSVVKKKPVSPEELCDIGPTPADQAVSFTVPELAEGDGMPEAGTWRWVNLWATWCKPCIEEMPLLESWQKTLTDEGTPMVVAFLSVDESADDVATFREKHPETPASPRMADPSDNLPTWMTTIGLDGEAPIPVHILVDPADKVRCVRAGQVHDRDLDAVRTLLKAG